MLTKSRIYVMSGLGGARYGFGPAVLYTLCLGTCCAHCKCYTPIETKTYIPIPHTETSAPKRTTTTICHNHHRLLCCNTKVYINVYNMSR